MADNMRRDDSQRDIQNRDVDTKKKGAKDLEGLNRSEGGLGMDKSKGIQDQKFKEPETDIQADEDVEDTHREDTSRDYKKDVSRDDKKSDRAL